MSTRGTSSRQRREIPSQSEGADDKLADKYENYKEFAEKKYRIPEDQEDAYNRADQELSDFVDTGKKPVKHSKKSEAIKDWIDFAADKAKVAVDASDEAIETLRKDTIPKVKSTASEVAEDVVEMMEDVYGYNQKKPIYPKRDRATTEPQESLKEFYDQAKEEAKQKYGIVSEKVQDTVDDVQSGIHEGIDYVQEEYISDEARRENERRARELMREGYEDARGVGSDVRHKITHALDTFAGKAEDLKGKAVDLEHQVVDSIEDWKHRDEEETRRMIAEAERAGREKGEAVREKASEKFHEWGGEATSKLKDVKGKVEDTAHKAKDKLGSAASKVRDKASDITVGTKSQWRGTKQELGDISEDAAYAKERVKDKVGEWKDDAGKKLSQWTDEASGLRSTADDWKSYVKDKAGEWKEEIDEKGRNVKETITEIPHKLKEEVETRIDNLDSSTAKNTFTRADEEITDLVRKYERFEEPSGLLGRIQYAFDSLVSDRYHSSSAQILHENEVDHVLYHVAVDDDIDSTMERLPWI